MAFRILGLLLILGCLYGCIGENPVFVGKPIKQVKLKLDDFEIIDLKAHKTVGDTTVTLYAQSDQYRLSKRLAASNIERVILYDKNTLTIKAKWDLMLGMPIGFFREYDVEGNILREVDNEHNYAFTPSLLKMKLKNEYSIDLEKKQDSVRMSRFCEGECNYTITISKSGGWFRDILINGTTGKTIDDKTTLPKECGNG